jgi:hypothetical protein
MGGTAALRLMWTIVLLFACDRRLFRAGYLIEPNKETCSRAKLAAISSDEAADRLNEACAHCAARDTALWRPRKSGCSAEFVGG